MQSKTPNHNIQNDTKKAVKQGHTIEYQNSFRKKKPKNTQQIPIMKEAKHNRKTATLLIDKLNI